MIMPEREVPLGLSNKVWVNNRLIEPGTYDRYRRFIDSTGNKHVTLRRLNCQYDTYNLADSPVYLEHRLRHLPSTDTTAPAEQIQDVPQLDHYRMPRRLPLYDRLHSNLYENQLTPENPESTLIWTANDLRAAGSTGFYIRVYSFTEVFPIEQILYVEKDPQGKRVTICCIMPDTTIKYATYCLPKITSAGSLT